MAFLLPSASALRRTLFSTTIGRTSTTFGVAGAGTTSRTRFAISSNNSVGFAAQRSYLNTMAREKILVVGTGWAGYTFSRALDDKIYDIQIVSPETAFPYTPLLASAACGLFDFSIAQEPIRSNARAITYYQARVEDIDFEAKVASCKAAAGLEESVQTTKEFDLSYDRLVLTPGCVTNTFGTPGAEEHAYFLRNVPDAIRVQQRIKGQLELASLPGLTDQQQRDLLHVVVIGGGPTGVEIAAELSDLLNNEMTKVYPHLADKFQISIFDAAGTILSPFDESLRKHSLDSFSKRGVSVTTNAKIKKITKDSIETEAEGRIPCGAVLWTAGNKANPLLEQLELAKSEKLPRILTDEYLHALRPKTKEAITDVFALGDAADIEGNELPTTAEVAVQKAEYLAHALNTAFDPSARKPFQYAQRATVAYIGGHDGVVQGEQTWTGPRAWAAWRSKNLGWVRNWRRRILILCVWALDRVYRKEGVVSRVLGEKYQPRL